MDTFMSNSILTCPRKTGHKNGKIKQVFLRLKCQKDRNDTLSLLHFSHHNRHIIIPLGFIGAVVYRIIDDSINHSFG